MNKNEIMSLPCVGSVNVLEDGTVTFHVCFSDNDVEKMFEIFDKKCIDERQSGLFLKAINDAITDDKSGEILRVNCATVMLSGMLKLCPDSDEPVRLKDIQFIGTCRNCGRDIDFSETLTMEQKRRFAQQYGWTKKNGTPTCRIPNSTEYCWNCHD